jgi:hypothetical protein
MTEENSTKAIAVDAVSWVRDPLSVIEPNNYFAGDGHTRVTLFAQNVALHSGEDLSSITCIAEDAEHVTYSLTVEYVGPVAQLDWVKQIVIRLPNELAGRGDISISLRLHGLSSNKALINVR